LTLWSLPTVFHVLLRLLLFLGTAASPHFRAETSAETETPEAGLTRKSLLSGVRMHPTFINLF
jgi:hypothetical protein